MASEYAYTDLPLSLRFSEDGEYAMIDTALNGVPIHLLTLYVGDQREKFTDAANAAQPASDPPAEAPASGETPPAA